MKKTIYLLIILMFLLTGCSKDNAEDSDNEAVPSVEDQTEDYDTEAVTNTAYSAQTTIHYSSGEDSNWAYGDLRKEFPAEKDCYVRVTNKVIRNKIKPFSKDIDIKITYRFTGVNNCNVEVADGLVNEVSNSTDSNVVEYEMMLKTNSESKAEDNIVVFKYTPTNNGSMVLEVLYDDNIIEQNDKKSTIYFEKSDEQSDEDSSTVENRGTNYDITIEENDSDIDANIEETEEIVE